MIHSGDHDATYLVAYDGGDHAREALRRAAGFASRTDARLVVVGVLPTDPGLAGTYDLAADGPYDPGAAADRLRAAVEEVAPDAAFRAERVDAYAGKGRIARVIRRVAREVDADVVVLGSDDPGRVVRRVARVDGADAAVPGGGDVDGTDAGDGVGDDPDHADDGDADADADVDGDDPDGADYDVFVVRSA